MLHASTSPFYPLFAALDVNAKIHEGESGAGCGRSAWSWALRRARRSLPTAI
jgi:arginine/lysine/ornithine decarboxylase